MEGSGPEIMQKLCGTFKIKVHQCFPWLHMSRHLLLFSVLHAVNWSQLNALLSLNFPNIILLLYQKVELHRVMYP